jgi:small-conductance mechanosensitive channel
MDLNEWLSNILFSIGEFDLTIGNVVAGVLLSVVLVVLYVLIIRRFVPHLFEVAEFDERQKNRTHRLMVSCLVLSILYGLLLISGLDMELVSNETLTIRISDIVLAVLLFQAARLFDLIIFKTLIHNYYASRGQRESEIIHHRKDTKETTHRLVQYFFYMLALLLIVRTFEIDYTLYTFTINERDFPITVSGILVIVLVILFARLINWIFTNLILYNYYKRKGIEPGTQYAFNRLLSYFIYILAALFALQIIGLNLTLIWGGLAALALGVGLGLQQTFNDLASGIILLFERSIEVSDIVLVDGEVGIVKRIGLRTSLVQTRENRTIIVPNSKLIVESVVNWSHTENIARFTVSVGVAYGSDTQLVRELLLRVAQAHEKVLDHPAAFVRFVDFGNSSLDFELLFWSQELFRIEDVQSDLRFEIDQAFRENGVTIPFPQRDVWFKNEMPDSTKNEA